MLKALKCVFSVLECVGKCFSEYLSVFGLYIISVCVSLIVCLRL